MGGFKGERGLGALRANVQRGLGVMRANVAEAFNRKEVRAVDLQDFARRAARYPYYAFQPGDLLGEVFPEAQIPQAPRVPEIHVSVRPTYDHGLEFSVRPSPGEGPQRIVYEEKDPQPLSPEVALVGLRRQAGEIRDAHERVLVAHRNLDAVQQRQVPPMQEGILASISSMANKFADGLTAQAALDQAEQAETDLFDMHRIENNVRAYQTFTVREPQLRAELAQLLPGAEIIITQGFGRQDLIDRVVGEHPDVVAWPDPTPASFRRSRRTESMNN